MTAVVFNIPLFRERFPAFTDPILYPDAVLQGYWDTAACIISPENYGCLNGSCREQALMLLVAHLAQLATNIRAGVGRGVSASASIDKVSVSMMQPPATDEWGWWLAQTPYGAQLWAMLSVKSVGGFYVGGRPERSAFRKVYGRY